MNLLSRRLLGTAAVLLLLGAFLHTSAFPRVLSAVPGSNLPSFLGQSLKALWLMDSITLLTLAVVFGLLAAKPGLASGGIVALVSLIPLGTAVLMYIFLGLFPGAHLLLVAGGLALAAGLLHINA